MKLFQCQKCGQLLHFENTSCERCGSPLGYLPKRETMTALAVGRESRHAQETIRRAFADQQDYRLCANSAHAVCNWLLPATLPDLYCAACRHNRTTCRHNRTIPDLSLPQNVNNWCAVEVAKHRLFYTLLQLRLPLATKAQSPDGLAFEFLSDAVAASDRGPVLTGHAGGVITINLAEADDAERERRRRQMGEPYRTLLGHFRHEIGHYYWDRLIAGTSHLGEFRRLFGDERKNYAQALHDHHAHGAPDDWAGRFLSGYASAHPWEDFAESFAHYFHMVDTLETAHVFGLAVSPRLPQGPGAVFDFHPRDADLKQLVEAWVALTFAVNAINRSMGLPDLYPFVLNAPAVAKLGFVAQRIGSAGAAPNRGTAAAPAA